LFDAILKPGCFKELSAFNFGGSCTQLLISKLLSYAIIGGALMLKVPQIVKITNNKSAAGISVSSIVIELIGFLIGASFYYRDGKPFSTYGEAIFISLQNLYIIYLCYKYGDGKGKGAGISFNFFFIVFNYLVLVYVFAFTSIIPLVGGSNASTVLTNYSFDKISKNPQILMDLFMDVNKLLFVLRTLLNLEYLQSFNIFIGYNFSFTTNNSCL